MGVPDLRVIVSFERFGDFIEERHEFGGGRTGHRRKASDCDLTRKEGR